jgi:neutral ceramidase
MSRSFGTVIAVTSIFARKTLKKFIRWFLGVVAILTLFVISLIGPVDNSPLDEKGFYRQTFQRLDTFSPTYYPLKTKLKAAWATINITPGSPMPMAGYTPRPRFGSVHDSIFIRILAIDNGSIPCFIISADLLIFPPALKNKIAEQNRGNRFLYFTATHIHSSVGAWDNSIFGNLLLGRYNEPWLDSLTRKITSAMDFASSHLQTATLKYFEVDASEFAENRLDPGRGQTDGKLRGLKIVREDGSRGLLVSYSAHPTNIDHLSLALSGDYPAALVNKAEQKDFDFAMFASGNIGSHRVKWMPEKEFAMCDTLGSRLYAKIKSVEGIAIKDPSISTSVIRVDYGPSQLHVLQDFKVRDWAFRILFSPLKGNITYLKIGKIIFLGMPCDFSGEIFTRDGLGKLAQSQGEELLITSFNGDYVGYITDDRYYGHSEQEEVMAMNWVGPHYGNYFSKIVRKIITKSK